MHCAFRTASGPATPNMTPPHAVNYLTPKLMMHSNNYSVR